MILSDNMKQNENIVVKNNTNLRINSRKIILNLIEIIEGRI